MEDNARNILKNIIEQENWSLELHVLNEFSAQVLRLSLHNV